MAAPPALLTLTLIDSRGRPTKRRYEITQQADLAAYIAVCATLIGALEDITDLGLARADMIIMHPTEGWVAGEDSNIDVGATFSGLIHEGNGAKASHKVPGFKMSLVGGDGSIALTGVVATYLGEFLDGEDFTLSNGDQIDSWLKGVLDK